MFTQIKTYGFIAAGCFVSFLLYRVGSLKNKVEKAEIKIERLEEKSKEQAVRISKKDSTIAAKTNQLSELVKKKNADSLDYKKLETEFQTVIFDMRTKNKQLEEEKKLLLTGNYCKNIFGKIVKCKQ